MMHTRFVHRLEREARLICITGSLPGETPSFDEKVAHGQAEQADKTDKEKPDGKKKESLRDYDTAELLLSSIVDKRNQKIEQAGKDAKKEADAVKTAQDFAAQVKASRTETKTQTASGAPGKPGIGETLQYEKKLAQARQKDFDDRTEVNKEADAAAKLLSVGDLAFGPTADTKVTQLGNEVPQPAAAVRTSEVTQKSTQERTRTESAQKQSVSEGTGNDAAPTDQTRRA